MYIRNLHAGNNLDFNLEWIFTIFGWVTVIVKFVPLVAQVAEMDNTIWVTSKIYLQLWNYIWLWYLIFKEVLEYRHIAVCISVTCATCLTNGTNLTMTVNQPKIKNWRLKYRLIPACKICTQNLHINNTFVDFRCPIFNSLINKSTPHWMPRILKLSPKLMLTLYALDN